MQQAFALPKGGAASAADGRRQVAHHPARRRHHAAPAATPEQVDRLKAELTRQMQSDIARPSIVDGLQKRYGLSVNEAALKQALGTGARAADTE